MRFLFLILFSVFLNAADTSVSNMQLYGVLTLLPPLMAIILAFITREVILSLFIGVFTGTFLLAFANFYTANVVNDTYTFTYNNPSFMDWVNLFLASFSNIVKHLLDAMIDSDDAGVILQVFCIGGVVALITKMGGINAVALALTRFVKGPVSAQVSTWLIGLCIFFDDYANSLTVGPIMRPIADKFKISREKLSFILDSTAAPVAGIAIISTWIGIEVGLIKTAYTLVGINDVNAFGVFMQTIPYRFYNIFMLIFVVLTAVQQREFGSMYIAEKNARAGIVSEAALDVGAELEKELKPKDGIEHKISDALIPILTLIITALTSFYFSGLNAIIDDPDKADILSKIEENYLSFYAIRTTLGEANSSLALFQAALFASVVAVILGLVRKKINHKEAVETWLHGWKSMIFTIAMLLFAWSLAAIVKELGTHKYIVQLLSGSTPHVLLPSMIFLIGSAMSFAIGTSYGTMGILMPLAIPLAHAVGLESGMSGNELHEYMVINISCVLTGAIFGNHCSPIADTVILSAMSAKCELSAHVKTQMPYALLVCAISVIFGYIPVSFGLNVYLTIILGVVMMSLALRLIGKKVE